MAGRAKRALQPLPPDLAVPVRVFTEELRRVYRERTEFNQRELATALNLSKSPISRYLNGQEIIPAAALERLCALAHLTHGERDHLYRLREDAARTPQELDARAPHQGAADQVGLSTGAVKEPKKPKEPEPDDSGVAATPVNGGGPDGRSRPRGWLRGVVPGIALVIAGVVIAVWSAKVADRPLPPSPRRTEPMKAIHPSSADGLACRQTRQYRVTRDGNLLDEKRHDIGNVYVGETFLLRAAPESNPYRFRYYGRVAGRDPAGYVDQAKLDYLGDVCD